MYSSYNQWLAALSGKQPEPEKPPEPELPPGDWPTVWRCDGSGGHGPVPVWWVPRLERWYCAGHLRLVLFRGWWKP